MKLYNLREQDQKLLLLDFYQLMELTDADEAEKQSILTQFSQLVFEHFMNDKVAEALPAATLMELQEKYPPISEENVTALMDEINKITPEVEQKYFDALLEVKAYLITEHYIRKVKTHELLLEEETNLAMRAQYEKVRKVASAKLELIDAGYWELLIV